MSKNNASLTMKELKQLWTSLPLKGPFAVLFVAWCAVFHWLGNSGLGYIKTDSLFEWLNEWYQMKSPVETGDELCPLAPFAVAMVVYLKREEFAAIAKRPWPPALLILGVGGALHVLGYLAQQTRISAGAFLVGGFGLMGLTWGVAWLRATAFPWFVLTFAIPVGIYMDSLTFSLRLWSTILSTAVCRGLLGIDLIRSQTSVMLAGTARHPGFHFEVAAACSGMRSVTAVIFISVVYAYLNFRAPWRRIAIVLIGIPLALFGNVVRLCSVFIAGDAFGENAGKFIETKMGFLTWIVALIGLFQFGRLLRETSPGGGPRTEPDAPSLKPATAPAQ
jgi:exosortase